MAGQDGGAGWSTEDPVRDLLVAYEELHVQNQELAAARDALEAERRRYQDLFDFSPDASLVTDLHGTILDANRAAVELLGVPRERLPGKPLAAYVRGSDLELLYHHLARLQAGEQAAAWEMRLSPRGDTAVDVAVKVIAVRGSRGEPAGLRWSIRDITERKQAEAEREAALEERGRLLAENRRQREFLERLIEVVPLGIAVLRGPEHRFELVNPYHRAIPGVPAGPLVGRTIDEVLPEEVARRARAGYDEVYATEQVFHASEFPVSCGTPDDTTYWDALHIPLLDGGSEAEGLLILTRDVTAEVLARRRLEDLAARERAILESLSEGLIVFDLDGNVLDMNTAALRLHGFEHVDGVRRHLREFGHVFEVHDLDGRPISIEGWPLSRVLSGETYLDWQVRVRNVATGSEGVWSYNGTPVRDGEGKVILGILTIRDVTGQQEMETLLRRQFAFLEQLVAEVPVGIAVVSGTDRRCELANPYFRAIAGFSHGSLLGQPVDKAWSEVTARLTLALIERVCETGQTVSVREAEVILVPGGEGTRWNVAGVPLFDAAGKVERVLILSQEVTEEVQARRQVEEMADRARRHAAELDAMLESMVEAVIVYDFADRPVRANRAARTAYGPALLDSDRSEIIRLINLRYLDGRAVALCDSPVDRALRGEVVQGVRYLFAHAEKGDRIMSASAAPVRQGEHSLGAVAVWHDITDQVRAEEQREAALQAVTEAKLALERQNCELRALTAELEAYDHTVAHDLKNPLSSVMGLAYLLAEHLEYLTEKEPLKMLRGIVDNSQRMKEIVDSLLLLSSARSQEVEIGPVDMGDIVAAARGELAAAIQQRAAQLTASGHWPAARGYAPWLRSVWVNYISNALKYGGQPARIELGAAPEPTRGMVRFWVRDHGPGLTSEQQARLFVPFSRLDRPDQLSHGLGLAIVRRLVERLGGQVGVDSRPGEGCTFWFTLPPA